MWSSLRSGFRRVIVRVSEALAAEPDDIGIGTTMEIDPERELMLMECRQKVRDIRDTLQSDAELHTKEHNVYQIVHLCHRVGKPCKDMLREEGVLEGLMTSVSQLEMRVLGVERHTAAYNESFVVALYRALGETVYDNVVNAEIAAHFGLLKVVEASLSHKSDEDPLTEPILTVVNNIIGMSQSTHLLLEEAGIVPLLVRFVGCQQAKNDNARQIATAALANLSNNAAMRDLMIRSRAVEVLATALRQFPPEAHSDILIPTVSYMQSLSAVVKIVGGGPMMAVGGDGEAITFKVEGSDSTRVYDERTNQLVLDRRSVKWMLSYLEAAMRDDPYPPQTNIYGTPWKVALSVACIARGSPVNRGLLVEEGVWALLAQALATLNLNPHGGGGGGGGGGRREEQEVTGDKVVGAMRALLRSPRDVEVSKELLRVHPDAHKAVGQLLGVAAHAGLGVKTRHAAAEVLCMWGCGWEAERLLWLAQIKGERASGSGAQGGRGCPASMLQASMIRHIMRYYVMGGMHGACDLVL